MVRFDWRCLGMVQVSVQGFTAQGSKLFNYVLIVQFNLVKLLFKPINSTHCPQAYNHVSLYKNPSIHIYGANQLLLCTADLQ